MSDKVPNRFPTLASPLKLALVGEAPGAHEEAHGEPFVGPSGRFLAQYLSRAGISRDACFLGNVCQVRPPNNYIPAFQWFGPEIQSGLAQLKEDLATFKPNVVVLLGNVPLRAAKDPASNAPLNPKAFRFKNSAWRGSLFIAVPGPLHPYKCLATYHPAYVLRDYSVSPLLQFDLKRAVSQARSPELLLPKRLLRIPTSVEEAVQFLRHLRTSKRPIALDIEGGLANIPCISFAQTPEEAMTVTFSRIDGTSCWSIEDEATLWHEVALLLEDSSVPKILQNSLYDRFVLQYGYGIRVQGVTEDTMLKHWEVYAEIEKNLGVQASIYTLEPYWKGERKVTDDKIFYEYCAKDSAVTNEINSVLDSQVRGSSLAHYRMNVSLLNPLLYMELRGMKYNYEGAQIRRQTVLAEKYRRQAKLNALTGRCMPTNYSPAMLRQRARELFSYVRASVDTLDDISTFAKKDSFTDASEFVYLMKQPPTLESVAQIEDLLKISLNVDSDDFTNYLYEDLKLPIQYKKRENGDETPTADYEALLKLSKIALREGAEFTHDVLQEAIELRYLTTRSEMLSIRADPDGRIRCGYNVVGSETGRITCYKSPTGSGYNLQTIPKTDRDLFLADSDHWFFQCDLAGADGWTVAAYSAMLGDRTMLDDYLFGLKPARILALMARGAANLRTSREDLKLLSKQVGADDWDYFAFKRVQHGGSYCEGGITISNNILKDSDGKTYMPPKECEAFRDKLFFARYPGIKMWHNWWTRRLSEKPVSVAASGQRRIFFDRRDNLLPKVVAHEPQANTTYATNLAMHRLWNSPENRRPDGSLRVEPLHQVHDALCGQFPKYETAFAVPFIKWCFNNPIQIAGQTIIIPFEGGYGESWGNLKEGEI